MGKFERVMLTFDKPPARVDFDHRYAVMRMFQPENGRDGYDAVNVPAYLIDNPDLLPSNEVMNSVIDLECKIRLSPESHALFRDEKVDDGRWIETIQVAAGVAHGLEGPLAVDLIRCAQVRDVGPSARWRIYYRE